MNRHGWIVAGLVSATVLGGGTVQAAQWVALDSSPAGTPAEIGIVAGDSSVDRTVVRVLIHGFWTSPRIGDRGQEFDEITIPGLDTQFERGVPDLPLARLRLAVPSPESVVDLAAVTINQSVVLSDYNVWPQPSPDQEFPDGLPERFAQNEAIYASSFYWPPALGSRSVGAQTAFGDISVVTCEMFPVRWNPSSGDLEVVTDAVYEFSHAGAAPSRGNMTRERARLVGGLFDNWDIVFGGYPVNVEFFEGEYLIIAPAAYESRLDAFVAQKSARGYDVEFLALETLGSTCDGIRAGIASWYAGTSAGVDHFLLLVGDTESIPLCDVVSSTSLDEVKTDDLYGSIDNNLSKEIYVGRLSVSDGLELSWQLAKILAYENQAESLWDYNNVALVAHDEYAPDKYEGAHESVRYASYSAPPEFIPLYGSAGTTDADVRGVIEDGVGIVAYRGHGSATAWTGWNLADEDFDAADIDATANSYMPVVWSFSCTNQDLDVEDCIGERWMKNSASPGNAAVAHYGATRTSYTTPNHELDRAMFQAVFTHGFASHAEDIVYAEDRMTTQYGDDNAWMYLLLGDPDMRIRRTVVSSGIPWLVEFGNPFTICQTCVAEVSIADLVGNPIDGARVAFWKPGLGRLSSEVFSNRYTGIDGTVEVPVSPGSTGWMYYTVQDDVGHAVFDSVWVSDVVATPESSPPAVAFSASPVVFSTSTTLGFGAPLTSEATVRIVDVSGRLVEAWDVAPGVTSLNWDGRTSGGARVSPGVYWAVLRTDRERLTVRLTVVG